MAELSNFFSRVKRLCSRLSYHFGIIAFFSLIWFLFRTGTKPTRAIYPCQQVARVNFFAFGLPLITPFWLRLKKYPRFRLKVLSLGLVTLFLIIGSFGFTKTRAKLSSLIWEFKKPLKTSSQVQASNGSRVVWIHDANATNWNFSSGYYGDYVNQNAVDDMVDQGVMALTGTSSVVDAWRQIIPNYQAGKTIAIKVNFNNSGYNDPTQIDALIHPINGIVRGLKQIGVREQDVWVYDASRCIPDRFKNGSGYSFHFSDGWCNNPQGFGEVINFASGVNHQLSNVLTSATYLINIPIIKRHGYNGGNFSVTLSFKNHYGSIKMPVSNYLHNNRSYSLVKLNSNSHIRNKTRLIVGDGLFGNWNSNQGAPRRWGTFGNAASNSLFFSTDPVAVDSVMLDLLDAETSVNNEPDQYLSSAEANGLGIYERGNPWGNGYNRIDFVRCEDSICPGTSPSTTPTPTLSPTPSPIIGDVNGDGVVDEIDYAAVIAHFGEEGTPGEVVGDVNNDGKVDEIDYAGVIAHFGEEG